MIELLKDLVRNVVLIVLLATFLEMLLPKGDMAKYISLVMGLFIIVAVLQPVVLFLDNGYDLELTAWVPPPNETQLQSILERAENLTRENHNLAAGEYKGRVEKQIEAIAGLVDRVKQVNAEVQFSSEDNTMIEISNVTIFIQVVSEQDENKLSEIRPVEIDLGEKSLESVGSGEAFKTVSKEAEHIKDKVTRAVCNFFGLNLERVDVIIENL